MATRKKPARSLAIDVEIKKLVKCDSAILEKKSKSKEFLSGGIRHVVIACDSNAYPEQFDEYAREDPWLSMLLGISWLHNAFVKPGVPKKFREEIKTVSEILHNLSLLYHNNLDNGSTTSSKMPPMWGKRANRMDLILEQLASAFNLIGEAPDISKHAYRLGEVIPVRRRQSMQREKAIDALDMALIYNSDNLYFAYQLMEQNDELKHMGVEEKYEALLRVRKPPTSIRG